MNHLNKGIPYQYQYCITILNFLFFFNLLLMIFILLQILISHCLIIYSNFHGLNCLKELIFHKNFRIIFIDYYQQNFCFYDLKKSNGITFSKFFIQEITYPNKDIIVVMLLFLMIYFLFLTLEEPNDIVNLLHLRFLIELLQNFTIFMFIFSNLLAKIYVLINNQYLKKIIKIVFKKILIDSICILDCLILKILCIFFIDSEINLIQKFNLGFHSFFKMSNQL
jgi:hypothetical protein